MLADPWQGGYPQTDHRDVKRPPERSGLDFGKLKDFDVLAAQLVPKSLLRDARLRLPLTTFVRSCCGLLDPKHVRFLTLATSVR